MVKLIGAHCKKFSELKVFFPFVVGSAKTIAAYIPNLKVLSLQDSLVEKEALVYIQNNMKNLDVLNLCHCLIVDEGLPAPGYAYAACALDRSIMERASERKNFLVCIADHCNVCQLMFITEGSSGWSDIGIWRRDMNLNVQQDRESRSNCTSISGAKEAQQHKSIKQCYPAVCKCKRSWGS